MNGYCSLIIKGNDLNFSEIENRLGIKASKKCFKGDCISEVIGKNQYDLISFNEDICESKTPDDAFTILLNEIMLNKQYIKQMHKNYEIVLKCFIQSSYAQVSFEISPDIIDKINQLAIKLEISILSWGGVDND